MRGKAREGKTLQWWAFMFQKIAVCKSNSHASTSLFLASPLFGNLKLEISKSRTVMAPKAPCPDTHGYQISDYVPLSTSVCINHIMKDAGTMFHWPIHMFRCIFIVFPTPLSKKIGGSVSGIFLRLHGRPSCSFYLLSRAQTYFHISKPGAKIEGGPPSIFAPGTMVRK